jgi:CDP-glucose 4,6-dehydratase
MILNEATHEILCQFLDCSKAKRLLNWKPRFDMDEGLRETIAWYREHYG